MFVVLGVDAFDEGANGVSASDRRRRNVGTLSGPPQKLCKAPENVAEDLARQFFHPARDSEGPVDDSLLLHVNTMDQYFISVSAVALLEVFQDNNLKEFFTEAVQGLVDILSGPRMFMLSHFDKFVARLLSVLETPSNSEMI
jgi:hypothetical protein